MNRYNLPLTQIINEWTAVLQPKTSMQAEGIFLQTKSTKEFFVDTLQYKLKREGGLGMILTELAYYSWNGCVASTKVGIALDPTQVIIINPMDFNTLFEAQKTLLSLLKARNQRKSPLNEAHGKFSQCEGFWINSCLMNSCHGYWSDRQKKIRIK